MKYIVLILLFLSAESSYASADGAGKDDKLIILDTVVVNCEDNKYKITKKPSKNKLVEKNDCEMILSYDPKTYDLFFVRLYARGAVLDVHSFSRKPTSYRNHTTFVGYREQLEISNSQEIQNMSSRFFWHKDKGWQIKVMVYLIETTQDTESIDDPKREKKEISIALSQII